MWNIFSRIILRLLIMYKILNWMYNKPAIAKSSDIYEWSKGFHKRLDGKYNGDKDLILIHLNRIDYISSLKRFIKNNTLVYNPKQEKHIGKYYTNVDMFDKGWDQYKESKSKLENIPEKYRIII